MQTISKVQQIYYLVDPDTIPVHSNKSSFAKFQLTKSLLQETSETPLPPHHTHGELANNFSDFFMSKTSKIRDQFTNSDNKESDDIPFSGESFFQCFRSLSEDDVLELLKKTPTKSSDLDTSHIPTEAMLRCFSSSYHKDHKCFSIKGRSSTKLQRGNSYTTSEKAWPRTDLQKLSAGL